MSLSAASIAGIWLALGDRPRLQTRRPSAGEYGKVGQGRCDSPSDKKRGVTAGVSVTGTRKTVAALYLPRRRLSASIKWRPAVTV